MPLWFNWVGIKKLQVATKTAVTNLINYQ